MKPILDVPVTPKTELTADTDSREEEEEEVSGASIQRPRMEEATRGRLENPESPSKQKVDPSDLISPTNFEFQSVSLSVEKNVKKN